MMHNPPWNSPPVYGPDPAFEEPPGRGRTRLLERVPVDAITRRAREVHPGRTLLLVIGGLLFGIGWATAKLAGVTWLAMAWSGSAVQVGWQSARGTLPAEPDIREVLAENERLRQLIARLPGEAPIPAGVA